MSSITRVMAKYLCIRCPTPLEAFPAQHVGTQQYYRLIERTYQEAKHLWSKTEMLCDILRNQKVRTQRVAAEAKLQNVAHYISKKVFFDASYIRIVKAQDAYDIFTVEPFHLFHLGISKRPTNASWLTCCVKKQF